MSAQVRAIAIDAMPILYYKYEIRDGAQSKSMNDEIVPRPRAPAAVPTGAVGQSRGPAAGLSKQATLER